MPDHRTNSSGAEELKRPEVSDEMIALYLEHVPGYLSDLRTAIDDRDQEKMDFQCHKMCSVMRMMGFDKIAEKLETIKKRDVGSDEVKTLSIQVEQMVDNTFALLNGS